jgi:hypothetical protein
VQQLLGHWEKRRYDFYLPMEHPPPRLLRYRAGQQDASFYMGQGLFAGSDGSVNYQKERMGTGYVVTQGKEFSEFFELVDYRPDLDGSRKTVPQTFYCLQPQKHVTE